MNPIDFIFTISDAFNGISRVEEIIDKRVNELFEKKDFSLFDFEETFRNILCDYEKEFDEKPSKELIDELFEETIIKVIENVKLESKEERKRISELLEKALDTSGRKTEEEENEAESNVSCTEPVNVKYDLKKEEIKTPEKDFCYGGMCHAEPESSMAKYKSLKEIDEERMKEVKSYAEGELVKHSPEFVRVKENGEEIFVCYPLGEHIGWKQGNIYLNVKFGYLFVNYNNETTCEVEAKLKIGLPLDADWNSVCSIESPEGYLKVYMKPLVRENKNYDVSIKCSDNG